MTQTSNLKSFLLTEGSRKVEINLKNVLQGPYVSTQCLTS